MELIRSDVPRCKIFENNVTGDDETFSDAFNRETFNQNTLFMTLADGASVEVFLSASDPTDDPANMLWIKYGDTISDSAVIPLNFLFRWIQLVRNNGVQRVDATLLSTRNNFS